jgi:uncharacterized membrane protein (DUF373 family)
MWSRRELSDPHGAAATRLFQLVTGWMVKLLVPAAIVALLLGVARIVVDLWQVLRAPEVGQGFDTIVAHLLRAFVVVELLRSVVEYYEVHQLDLTLIIDAAVVFLLREVMVGVYGRALDGGQLGGVAALLLVVLALRLAVTRWPGMGSHDPPPGGDGHPLGPPGSLT